MTSWLKALFIISLLSTVGPRVAIGKENVYVLRGSDIACMQAHPDNYQVVGQKRRLLAVSLCPDVSTDPGTSVLLNDGPPLEVIVTTFDSAIYAGELEVECLLSLTGIVEEKLYTVDFERCTSEVKD